ncbi:MAG: hypothetical protein PHF63_00705 [Herbinix sp.]|nr:hypothetical protein [Herbinix sp.]
MGYLSNEEVNNIFDELIVYPKEAIINRLDIIKGNIDPRHTIKTLSFIYLEYNIFNDNTVRERFNFRFEQPKGDFFDHCVLWDLFTKGNDYISEHAVIGKIRENPEKAFAYHYLINKYYLMRDKLVSNPIYNDTENNNGRLISLQKAFDLFEYLCYKHVEFKEILCDAEIFGILMYMKRIMLVFNKEEFNIEHFNIRSSKRPDFSIYELLNLICHNEELYKELIHKNNQDGEKVYIIKPNGEALEMNNISFNSFLTNVDSAHLYEVMDIIDTLQSMMDIDIILKLFEKYTNIITDDPLFQNTIFKPEEIFLLRDINNKPFYIVNTGNEIGILLEDKIANNFMIIVPLYDIKNNETNVELINYFKNYMDNENLEFSTKCIKLEFSYVSNKTPINTPTIQEVFESFSFDKEGNIKIKFSKNKSYMDQYSECHKILVENIKNRNYESAKYDLAFLFSLISTLDSKIKNNDSDYKNPDKKIDIDKARMFAINDFKTYLKVVQSNDKRFNFADFYKEKEFGKTEFAINVDTLVNIKNLVFRIMTGF